MTPPEQEPDHLPEFERPPLVEVVLGVQFDSLPSLTSARMGAFWQTIRKSFPKTEDRPPLPTTFEVLPGAEGFAEVQFSFGVPMDASHTRAWFVSADGHEVLQLQHDRLLCNWRRASPSSEYPRYPRLRQRFAELVAGFEAYLAAEQLGSPRYNQCEVAYINHIPSGGAWEKVAELGSVFRCVPGVVGDQPFDEPTDVNVQLAFPIAEAGRNTLGRLHVKIETGRQGHPPKPAVGMALAARGAPLGGTELVHALGFLDLGREAIVRGFASLTTAAMHKEWGRRR